MQSMLCLQSGGSIEMWHSYFGPGLTMYGIDINPYCKVSCWTDDAGTWNTICLCTCLAHKAMTPAAQRSGVLRGCPSWQSHSRPLAPRHRQLNV